MDVFWLEQCEASVPTADDWLSASETIRSNGFHIAKRRADWRLGRWTAKCAVAAVLKLSDDPSSLRLIEISAAPTGEPEVVLVHRQEDVTISISHRGGIAICAVATGNVQLGCDLEVIEARGDAFVADYFTTAEQDLIARASVEERALLVSLLWSAKESALKAMHVGLRADTRTVAVEIAGFEERWSENASGSSMRGVQLAEPSNVSPCWRRFQVRCVDGTDFCGWWQRSQALVRTVVAAPPPEPPIDLTPMRPAAGEMHRP